MKINRSQVYCILSVCIISTYASLVPESAPNSTTASHPCLYASAWCVCINKHDDVQNMVDIGAQIEYKNTAYVSLVLIYYSTTHPQVTPQALSPHRCRAQLTAAARQGHAQ